MEAWRAHDTGLVALPTRFRRLSGQVRHLRGTGLAWPERLTLVVADGTLTASDPDGAAVGAWPVSEVQATSVATGPPASFVVEVPGGVHLLSAAPGPALDRLLAALAVG